MSLDRIKSEYSGWQYQNFGQPDLRRSLLKFLEEVGELCAAVYRSKDSETRDAVADVFISFLGLALACGVDLSEAVPQVWDDVVSRRNYR